MKREEKETLHALLEAARGWVSDGEYRPRALPVFMDDPEVMAGGRWTDVDSLYRAIADCRQCRLSETRTNTVPGTGSNRPLVMVIGEGPGADEDAQGLPFVGKAGQLLDRMLSAIGLSRGSNVHIANIVKCRPPNNRDPEADEADCCAPWLEAQIGLLNPKVILALGRVAAQRLLDTKEGIGRLHGQFLEYRGIPLMPTYHPSALLRDESLKRPAWEDLKLLREHLLSLCPDYEGHGDVS